MADLFPPIYEGSRVNERYDPTPRTTTIGSKNYRVFSNKQIVDSVVLTTYDLNGNIKTVIRTGQHIDYFV